MKAIRLLSLSIACTLLATISVAAGAAPLAGPCAPGAAYDPACDVNHDNQITIADIQLTASHWNQTGMWVSDNQHNHLGQTWVASNNPLGIEGSVSTSPYAPLVLSNSAVEGDGLRVSSVGDRGVVVASAGGSGVVVDSAGNDGVSVGLAGSPFSFKYSPDKNGFEVAGAEGNGLYVGRAGDAGVYVDYAATAGVYVKDGSHFGVYVDNGGEAGVVVEFTSGIGVYVDQAGLPSFTYPSGSFTFNGFEVAGAHGNGLYVGRADEDGVYVVSAGDDGVKVNSAGYDGVEVISAANDGVWADTTYPEGYWGLYTPDRIGAGTAVAASALTLIARVGGDSALTPGDVVAAAGVSDPLPGSTIPLALVRPANPSFAGIVGVVERRMALTPKPQQQGDEAQEPVLELRGADGPARPGDYVAITVLGAAQVKLDNATPIEAGQRLTIAANGWTRPLGAIKVQLAGGEGTADIAENAPVIGVALETAKDGLVWVLVNPQ